MEQIKKLLHRARGRAAAALLSVVLALSFTGCGPDLAAMMNADNQQETEDAQASSAADQTSGQPVTGEAGTEEEKPIITLDNIPAYTSEPTVEINGNVPFFTEADRTENAFESYSDLDSLGRCGAASACIGEETMPTEERGDIGMIKPSGWHTVKYDGIDGNYLYNRCHLIAYMLSGENANEKNLITGTRYMNTEGMLPFEERTADYIHITGHHVLYRVTPIFEGDNLVASGVLMEAKSVEDEGLCFCVYCYNVQPNVTIDYATGDSTGPEFTGSDGEAQADASEEQQSTASEEQQSVSEGQTEGTYVLNTNTMKFHRPDCPSVDKMASKNRQDYTGSRDDLIAQGYEPCKNCNP